jgi:hypothetical protein
MHHHRARCARPYCPYSRSLRSPCAGQVTCARLAARNPSPPPSLLSFFLLLFFPLFLSYSPSLFVARCARLALCDSWSSELRAPRGAQSLSPSLPSFLLSSPLLSPLSFLFTIAGLPALVSLPFLSLAALALRCVTAGQVSCARLAARNPSPPPSLLSFFLLLFFPLFLSYSPSQDSLRSSPCLFCRSLRSPCAV